MARESSILNQIKIFKTCVSPVRLRLFQYQVSSKSENHICDLDGDRWTDSQCSEHRCLKISHFETDEDFLIWPSTALLDLAACQNSSNLVNLSLRTRQIHSVQVDITVYIPEQNWPPISHFKAEQNFKNISIMCGLSEFQAMTDGSIF